jgi:HSP20 family protein
MLPSIWKKNDWFPVFSLRSGIDKLFEDFFGGEMLMAPFQANGKQLPAMDVKETDEAIMVDAEMPGLKQEDIKVSVEEGILNISAERKEEKNEKTKNVHRLERYYGQMDRKLSLPSSVEEGKVEATYKDGILHIILPKKASAKPKAVAIKVK